MITVFTRPSCAYCPVLKKYLSMKNIEFVEREAEGDEYFKLANKFGVSVPLLISGDNGLTGFNPSAVNRMLGI